MWVELLPTVPPTPAGVDDRVAPRGETWRVPVEPPPVPADPRARPLAEVAEAVAERAGEIGQGGMSALVGRWSRDDRRLVALQMHFSHAHDTFPSRGVGRALVALLFDRVGFTRDDLLWSFAVLADAKSRSYKQAFHLPALIAAELPDDELAGLLPVFDAVAAEARDTIVFQEERVRVARLYGDVLDRLTDQLPPYLLHDGDSIGPAVRGALGEALAATGMRALLLHSFSLAKPMPSKAWLRTGEARLAAAAGGGSTVSTMLEVFAGVEDYAHEDTDTLMRGLVWLLARDPGAPATDLLARVAVAAGSAATRSAGYPFAPRTAAAAVEALAERPGDVPPRALARLMLAVKNKALRARVAGALERASAQRGWAPGEAAELAVDNHGLGPDGGRSFPYEGGLVLVVAIDGDKPRVLALRHGTALKSVPPGVDASVPRSLVKQLGKTLGLERARVEGLFSSGREWAWETWVERYLIHPVTGSIARRLIWEASDDGVTWRAAVPEPADGRWSLGGRDDWARVRLWHPLGADPAEVADWRDRVTEAELRQPFKQAFREVYPLTPAEEATRVYSNRFAAHILRYRQAAALMGVRGWQASYLGFHDGGYEGEATREFGGGVWRASFFYELADQIEEASDFGASYCSTDQVRFARRDGRAWTAAPLSEVPPLVFSEAMRDVDLFVGVTSIAADEAWADRGEHRFHDYWQQASFGELTGGATVRRDVLARLLPRLAIGPRCELDDRFLRVRGTRGTYKIHLGSGNILIEPNDRYLCIGPNRPSAGQRVALPFDDDHTLSVILSKAIMLSADNKITDPTILAQLPSPTQPPR